MSGVEVTQLPPCPFCGGEAKLWLGQASFDDAQIVCGSCHMSGPNFDESPYRGAGARNFNAAEAIAAWKTRASPAPSEDEADDPDWIGAGIPDEAVEAGMAAWAKADHDLANYVSGVTPDWDESMIVCAIYKAMAPLMPAPAPSEEDDLRLARDVIREWLDVEPENKSHVGLLVLAAIRAERKRAGGVKATAAFIAAMGAAAGIIRRYRDETPPGHSPHMICHEADEVMEQLTAQIEAARKGE